MEKKARTIDAPSVWDEAKLINLVHKVLQSIIGNVEELGLDKAFDNPETIPVVYFPETTT